MASSSGMPDEEGGVHAEPLLRRCFFTAGEGVENPPTDRLAARLAVVDDPAALAGAFAATRLRKHSRAPSTIPAADRCRAGPTPGVCVCVTQVVAARDKRGKRRYGGPKQLMTGRVGQACHDPHNKGA